MSRKLMWGVLAIGIALILAPFAMGLPGRSASGEKMIDAFAPIMEEDAVATTADYYDNVFVPLGDVSPAMSQENVDRFNGYLAGIGAMGSEAQALAPAFAAATGMDEAQVGQYFADEFPAMTQMMQRLTEMQRDFEGLLGLMGANVAIFEQVPGGLAHYEPLVRTMQEQRENYQDVAGLPDFRAFTWFFVVPGLLLVGLALTGLFGDRRRPAPVAVDRDLEEQGARDVVGV